MNKTFLSSPLMKYIKQTPSFQVGIVITLFWIISALLAPYILPYNPTETHLDDILTPPNRSFLLGTDKDGLDIFSRIFYAARIDLGIAISSTAIAFSLGILLGVIGGYFVGGGGVIGVTAEWMMRAVDVIQSFPVFIFALALVAALGASAINIIMAMVFVNTPVFIWLTRSEVLSVRQKPFIEGARCSGNSEIRIAMRHILPNSLAAALTQLSVVIGFSILLTASISFIGAGIRVPTPEWGLMVSQGASTMITGQWWVALFPGLALASSVLGFALLGDGFRNFIDPKRRVAGYGKKVKKKPQQITDVVMNNKDK